MFKTKLTKKLLVTMVTCLLLISIVNAEGNDSQKLRLAVITVEKGSINVDVSDSDLEYLSSEIEINIDQQIVKVFERRKIMKLINTKQVDAELLKSSDSEREKFNRLTGVEQFVFTEIFKLGDEYKLYIKITNIKGEIIAKEDVRLRSIYDESAELAIQNTVNTLIKAIHKPKADLYEIREKTMWLYEKVINSQKISDNAKKRLEKLYTKAMDELEKSDESNSSDDAIDAFNRLYKETQMYEDLVSSTTIAEKKVDDSNVSIDNNLKHNGSRGSFIAPRYSSLEIAEQYYQKAIVCERNRDGIGACNNYIEALKYNSQHYGANIGIARCGDTYYKSGDIQSALNVYQAGAQAGNINCQIKFNALKQLRSGNTQRYSGGQGSYWSK
ncbi:MAG: hypothetical protein JEZ07_14375 [Phycisphaerae bacterium]|nr:hypothetical protein [Phycisphaerae bacterium]